VRITPSCKKEHLESTTVDSTYRAPLIGHNGDSGRRDPEKSSQSPSTRPTPSRKRIALVAHDNRKEKMARWVLKHRAELIEHDLYATDNAALMIAEALHAPVFRLLNAPLGADQQIGESIAESKIDVLISFWDPVGFQSHDADVKALLRLVTACNIPNACNEATADCLISSLLFDSGFRAVSESDTHNLLSIKEAANHLQLPLSRLYYLVQRGRIPAIQIGGRLRIKESSLEGQALRRDQRGRPAVLVIENDPNLQEQFRTFLRKTGFSRTVVGTGKAAITHLRKERFDLMFLDLQLPGTSAEEVCKRARQMDPELHIIVLTGPLESEIIDRILQASSPVTFLKKPLKFEHLEQTVTILGGRASA
jgi:methylglyoxal synthase